MIVYGCMAGLLYGVAFVSSLTRRRPFALFGYLALLFILHDGLRWDTATDWENYYLYFQHCLEGGIEQFEAGYCLLNESIRTWTSNYTVFLLVHATIVWSLFFPVIWRFSPQPFLSVYLLYCMLLPSLGMNRQYIALALCVGSILFIYKKRFLPFACMVSVAFFFHKSALCFLPAYFLYAKFPTGYYVGALLLVVSGAFFNIVDRVPLSFLGTDDSYAVQQLFFYIADAESNLRTFASSVLGIGRISLGLFGAIWAYKRGVDEKFMLLFNLYFCYILIYWLFNGSIFQIFVARGLVYFSVFEIFIIPYIFSSIRKQQYKCLFLIFLLVYTAALLYKNITYYTIGNINPFIPYKFCFL